MKYFCYLLILLSANAFAQNNVQIELFDITLGHRRTTVNVKVIPYSDYVFSKNDYGITILGWSRNGKIFFEHQYKNINGSSMSSYCVLDLIEDKVLIEERYNVILSNGNYVIENFPGNNYINEMAKKYDIINNTGAIGNFPYMEDFSGKIWDIKSVYTQFSDDYSMIAKRFETVWITNNDDNSDKSNIHLFVYDNLNYRLGAGLGKRITRKLIPRNLRAMELSYHPKYFYQSDKFVKSPFENRVAIIIPQLILLDDNSIIFGCHLDIGFTLKNFWDEIYPKNRE
jgi:hypothetical protein